MPRHTLAPATLIGALAAAAFAAGASAAPAPREANDEYGIDLAFPAGAHACVAESGTHPYGLFVRLGAPGAPCDDTRWTRSMGVYADYNVLFHRSARAAIAGYCDLDGPPPPAIRRTIRNLGFPSGRSERCARTRGRIITITVMTLAGRWPDDGDPWPDWKTPRTTYRAWLETDPDHLAADLTLFRAMLADAVLRPDQGL